MVVAYLLMFRVDELGWKKLQVILGSQDATSMHLLVGLAMDDARMHEWVVDTWARTLDRSYIEGTILARLARYQHSAAAWMEATRHAAFGAEGGAGSAGRGAVASGGGPSPPASQASHGRRSSKARRKPPTEARPFNLTQARPRVLPQPKRLPSPKGLKAKPIPQSLHRTSLAEVEAAKALRREELRLAAASKYDPRHVPALTESKSNLQELQAEARAREDAQLDFDRPKARPVPRLPAEGADVKLNAAAILREEALFRKRQQKEAKVVAEYEANMRDASEFKAWQAKAKAADDAAAAAVVAARHVALAESAATVAASQRRKVAGNARIARAVRREGEAIKRHRDAEAAAATATKRGMAEAVKQHRQTAPAAAVAAVVEAKRASAAQLKAEKAAAEAEAAAAREAEAAEKADMMARIQALERAPARHFKGFDPSEAYGYGLLEEMSLVEMSARLDLLRAQRKEEEEAKRRSIMAEKRKAADGLAAKLATLRRVRSAAADVNRSARAAKQRAAAEEAATVEAARAKRVVQVSEKLAAKRQRQEEARAAAAAVEARSRKQAQFLGEAKSQLEQARFDEQLAARERAAKQRAAAAAKAADAAARASATDAKSKQAYAQAKRRQASRRAAAAAAKAQGEADEAAEFLAAERQRKKAAFFTQAAREGRLAAVRDAADTYSASVRAVRSEAARAAWGGVPRAEQAAQAMGARMERLSEAEVQGLGLADTVSRQVAAQAAVSRRLLGMENPLVAAGLTSAGVREGGFSGTLSLAAQSAAEGSATAARQRAIRSAGTKRLL